MKKLFLLSISVLLLMSQTKVHAQEKFGNTINAGMGIGYYGYTPNAIPAFNINYEFDVAPELTVAPFISAFTYNNYIYWGDEYTPYRDYSYHRTVVPVGGKATYYFDGLLNAGKKWDFYAAGSIGFSIVSTTYEEGYNGSKKIYNGISPLYIDAHLGSEYHATHRTGIYLDLSTGLSTLGIAIHL